MNFQSRFGISNSSRLEVMENICNWQMVRGIIFLFSFFVPLPTPLDELGLCMANKFLRKWLNTLYQRFPQTTPRFGDLLRRTYGYDLLQGNDRKKNQQRMHRGQSGGKPGKSFQESFPSGETQDTFHSPSYELLKHMWNVVYWKAVLDWVPMVFTGSWSLGTFCLSCTPIPDSQKESRVLK